MYDVCIVGAGAAGLTAAVKAASLGLSVIIFDKNKKIGNKIYATGNGKCNLSNNFIKIDEHYNSVSGDHSAYLSYLFNKYNVNDTLRGFFDLIGLKTYADKNGYIYPCSNQASSVVWALKDYMLLHNVTIVENEEVIAIKSFENGYIINDVKCRYLILACGGKSYSKLGGSDSGYKLSKSIGVNVTRLYPALCPLICNSSLCDADGVRIKAKARLLIDDKIEKEESGEIQITSYGLSGIAVFNLSSKANIALENGKKVEIEFNILENTGLSSEECVEKLTKNSDKTILASLNGLTNEKLAIYALNKVGVNPKTTVNNLDITQLQCIINELCNCALKISSSKDFDMAQVTCGGVCLSEIIKESNESVNNKNLYIIGEMLDIDGICGGYNITFAILSAMQAIENIYDKNKSDKN